MSLNGTDALRCSSRQWRRSDKYFHSRILSRCKNKGKKVFNPVKVEMQFLENHKNLLLELHHDSSKIENVLQSEASLHNCFIAQGAAVLPGPPAGNDDGDNSEISD